MLFIFLQGQPMDGFSGAMSESQLKQLLAQLVNAGPEGEIVHATLETAAQLVAEGNVEQAVEAYKSILEADENNIDALAGLARCFIALSDLPKAEQVLSQLPEDKQTHEAVVAAKATLSLAKTLPQAADEAKLRKAIAANPLDHAARFELAGALFAKGRHEEGIAELLAITAKSRDWNEGAARTRLLTFFEALGHTHPLTMQGRRKLSTILFS